MGERTQTRREARSERMLAICIVMINTDELVFGEGNSIQEQVDVLNRFCGG